MLASLLTASIVHATDDERPKVSVAYSAPADCPSESAFLAAVRARSPLAAAGPGAAFSVEIESAHDGVVAHLLTTTRPQVLVRSVRGRDCADVVRAIALLTAIAIDASGQTRVDREPPSLKTPHLPDLTVDQQRSALPGGDTGRSAAPSAQPSRGVSVRSSASVRSGFAPNTGYGGSVDGVFMLSSAFDFGIGTIIAASDGVQAAQMARVRATLLAGRVTLCYPARQERASLFGICALGELGMVQAVAVPLDAGRRGRGDQTPWFAVGSGLFLRTPEIQGMSLFAEGGASVPLLRREYRSSDPEAALYELGIAFNLAVGAALHFW